MEKNLLCAFWKSFRKQLEAYEEVEGSKFKWPYRMECFAMANGSFEYATWCYELVIHSHETRMHKAWRTVLARETESVNNNSAVKADRQVTAFMW